MNWKFERPKFYIYEYTVEVNGVLKSGILGEQTPNEDRLQSQQMENKIIAYYKHKYPQSKISLTLFSAKEVTIEQFDQMQNDFIPLFEEVDLLELSKQILAFLRNKNDYQEHDIQYIASKFLQTDILKAIDELSNKDLVYFPNNDPPNGFSFVEAGEATEPTTINYPILARLID